MKTKKATIRLRRNSGNGNSGNDNSGNDNSGNDNSVYIDLTIELKTKSIKNMMKELSEKIPESACENSVLEYIYFYEIADFKTSDWASEFADKT